MILNKRFFKIKEVSREEEKEFLNKYYLEGFIDSNISIGVYYNNELIALQSFIKDKETIILLRIISKNRIQFLESHKEPFKYFLKNYNREKMNIII
jgi:hypothetical protein